jgi:hypothetical protein
MFFLFLRCGRRRLAPVRARCSSFARVDQRGPACLPVNCPEELCAAAPTAVAGHQLASGRQFRSFEFRRDWQRMIPSFVAVAETRQPRHEVRQPCGLLMDDHDLLDRAVNNRATRTPPAGRGDDE